MIDTPQHFAPDRQDTQITDLSLPEVNALCLRAARGVGWSWGMAEECGEAASWLAQAALPWADIILNCLQNPVSTQMQPAPREWANPHVICGLHAGVTLADFAGLPEGPSAEGITLGTVQDARLLLPFAARCAGRLGAALDITVASQLWATISADAFSLTTTNLSPGRVQMRLTHTNQPALRLFNSIQTAPLTPHQKTALDAIALNMTVPSSAQSEARAGADTPDTD